MSAGVAITKLGAGLAVAISVHTVVNSLLLRRPRTAVPMQHERVSLLIPVRDEAEQIGPCLEAALAQTGLVDFEIVVLDDGSIDATKTAVERFIADRAATHGPSLRLVDGGDAPLPEGWLGKPWACERLRQAVERDVVVYIDADVRLEPHALASSVALLRQSGLDLVSPYPRQLAVTFGERLVQPLLQWLWMSFLPLRLAERTRPNSMAAANGQFLVMDAAALDRAGGFAAVRGEVLDDVALVRAFKRTGGRGVVVDGTHLATCRMYTYWSALKAGYTKNLWAGTGSVGGAIWLGSMLALAYLVPPAAAFGLFGRRARPAGLVGYLAGVAGRVVSARRTGGRVADSAMHPFSIAALLRLLALSWRAKRAGTIEWKGRNLG
jgi:hypothetical protein